MAPNAGGAPAGAIAEAIDSDYRNARPKYLEAFWNLVNRDFVNAILTARSVKRSSGAPPAPAAAR